MKDYSYGKKKHCRWCGIEYYAFKPEYRDGFCSRAHRQAHYRAYKSYVTHSANVQAKAALSAVTHKKRRK